MTRTDHGASALPYRLYLKAGRRFRKARRFVRRAIAWFDMDGRFVSKDWAFVLKGGRFLAKRWAIALKGWSIISKARPIVLKHGRFVSKGQPFAFKAGPLKKRRSSFENNWLWRVKGWPLLPGWTGYRGENAQRVGTINAIGLTCRSAPAGRGKLPRKSLPAFPWTPKEK